MLTNSATKSLLRIVDNIDNEGEENTEQSSFGRFLMMSFGLDWIIIAC
jgi:tRNA 2-selenouridine synthase SelU